MSLHRGERDRGGEANPTDGVVRLIVPVYLPSLDGYFEQGLQVLDAMMRTVSDSIDDRVLVTVIDNGCCPDAAAYLRHLLETGRIDRLVRNHLNRGKVDAVLAELRSSLEPVLVVSDADVAFRPGWVDATLGTLNAFPECGMLALHPQPEMRKHASSSLLVSRWTHGRLVRAAVVDDDDMERFAQSVGRPFRPRPAKGDLTVVRNGAALLVGFGHFVFAVRKQVVADLPQAPSLSTRNGIDIDFFEFPADGAGWWCASIPRALVHHIGNTISDDETGRIASFVAQGFADPVSAPSPPRAAPFSRVLGPRARRAVVAILTRIEGNRWLGDRLLPVRMIEVERQSAFRVGPVGTSPEET